MAQMGSVLSHKEAQLIKTGKLAKYSDQKNISQGTSKGLWEMELKDKLFWYKFVSQIHVNFFSEHSFPVRFTF